MGLIDICGIYRRDLNVRLLIGFLSGPIRQLAFDEQDARVAGELRSESEAMGRPIGEYDLLIGGQALRHKQDDARDRQCKGVWPDQKFFLGRLVQIVTLFFPQTHPQKRLDLGLTFKEQMLLSLGCTVACLLDRRP
jgi:hypothetical protein